MNRHCNAAGIMGGNPVCGSAQAEDLVVANDERVDCLACLAEMVKQGYTPTKEQAEMIPA